MIKNIHSVVCSSCFFEFLSYQVSSSPGKRSSFKGNATSDEPTTDTNKTKKKRPSLSSLFVIMLKQSAAE